MATVPCPTCEKPVDLTIKTPFRPFCCERCRLIDLGAWANEEYQIAGRSPSEQLGDPDVESEEAKDWDAGQLH